MAVSEKDLETLEVWLDGELPADQVDSLRARMSSEPELAGAVAHLRADRETRSQIWQTIEPGDTELETLISNVRRGVKRDEIWTLRFRALRNISTIAASIVLMFAIGWISRDRLHMGPESFTQPVVARGDIALPNVATQRPKVLTGSQNIGLVNNVVASDGTQITGTNSIKKSQPMFRVTVEDRFGNKLIRDISELSELGKVSEEFTRAMLQPPSPQQPK